MTDTFSSAELPNLEPFSFDVSAFSRKCTLKGATNDFTKITALIALAGPSKSKTLLSGKVAIQTLGTKASLVAGGITYTNMVIMDGVEWEEVRGTAGTWYKYKIKLEQETK